MTRWINQRRRKTDQRVSPVDVPALARYFEAHRLLPRDYVFDPREKKYRRIVTMAVKLLQDPGASKKERTRAIVILGHSPVPHAIDVLKALAASDHSQAKMARMALDECLSLAARAGLSGSPAAGGMS